MFPRYPGIYPIAAMAIYIYTESRLRTRTNNHAWRQPLDQRSANEYDIHAGNTMNGTETWRTCTQQ